MFKILEHLPESLILRQSRSEVVATCPNCGGNKLKINARSGAYACYSNHCEPAAIRKALGYVPKETPFKVHEFKVREFETPAFSNPNLKPRLKFFHPNDFQTLANPPPFLENAKFERFRFIYDTNHVLRRYPYVNKDGKKGKAFSYSTLIGEEWVDSNGFPYDWNIYKPFKESIEPGANVLFTEGEKVAYCLSSIGLPTITVPAFGFNPTYLEYVMMKLKPGGIYYLADNDKEGLKKCNIIKTSCTNLQIPHNSFVFDDPRSGFDAADFIFELPTRDIACLRHHLLSTITF